MVMGRRPEEGQVRDEVLKVRITQATNKELEAARGAESRAEFAREAIKDRIRARKGRS